MHNFRNLDIWKRSLTFSIEILEKSKTFPSEYRYEISSQINRCAVSIPSNIAEGSAGKTDKEFARFLGLALGSSFELETQLIIINELINQETLNLENKITELKEIQRMIRAFKERLD